MLVWRGDSEVEAGCFDSNCSSDSSSASGRVERLNSDVSKGLYI
jgi:hypothetical protein